MKYTKSHEWVKMEGDIAVVGITDYAQKQIGDVVFIELPQAGEYIAKASQFSVVESTKAASEVYAPVSGEVVEVNDDLLSNPQWINHSPLGKGWMIKVKVNNTDELTGLLDEEAYKEFIEKESH